MFKLLFKFIKWTVLVLLILGTIAWFYPEKFLTVDTGSVSADVLIVLGGSGSSHDRALRAAQLYAQRAAPRIIITGAGDDQINRHILLEQGVPDRVIEIEGKSTTTHENAEFTGRLLRAERVRTAILVTSWYHARRAEKTFAHCVPGVNFFSRPSYYGFARADWVKAGINKRMRLEFLKLPGYCLRYGINPF
jgi:uncharacterized SAM-binding protein YcdF (DUF218 family)